MAAACAWHVPRDSVSWHVTFSWQRCPCCSVSDHWEHLSQQVTCPLYADCGDPALTPVLRNRVISSSREAPCKLCVIRCWMFPSAGPGLCSWWPAARRRAGPASPVSPVSPARTAAICWFRKTTKEAKQPWSQRSLHPRYTTAHLFGSELKPWSMDNTSHILRFIVNTEIILVKVKFWY